MPKQIMTPEYSSFSLESKLLFSMVFTNAEHIKAITETAELIDSIGERELSTMKKLFREQKEESEEQVNV
jgi:hypothetical protein